MRVLLVVLLVFFAQACSAGHNNNKSISIPASLAPSEPNVAEGDFPVGESVADRIAGIKVLNLEGKVLELNKAIVKNNKNKVFILVKPGCVFCESLLSTLYILKPKISADLYFFLDKKHGTFEEMKKKYELNKKIKAIWLYDHEDRLAVDLHMNSFPKFMVLDKDYKILAIQLGLVMPKDKASLKGMDFPIILQKLSENTVTWLGAF